MQELNHEERRSSRVKEQLKVQVYNRVVLKHIVLLIWLTYCLFN